MRFIRSDWFFLFCILASVTSVHALTGAKTWSDLASKLPSANHPSRPLVIETGSIDNDIYESMLQGKPALYLDRNRWDPNAQRAWLALEAKNADYVTVLVDDDYSNPETNNLPQLRWPDGLVQRGSDIYDILEKVQTEFPDSGPDLYPQGISVSVDIVRAEMSRFDGIMLRYTKPSAVAPFIFRTDPDAKEEGEIVQRFKYEVTLEEMEEMLEEYDDGPFLAGSDFTAADIWYAPYLERFAAHLPILYNGLKPRSLDYEALKDWYDAMDTIPCYSCRVKGRVETWQSVLAKAHPELDLGNTAVPNLPKKKSFVPNKIWAKYAAEKPYLAETPAQEVAAQILRLRESLVTRIAKACPSVANPDDALLEVCNALLELPDEGKDNNNAATVASKLSGDARDVASFLTGEEGLSVPRDIGLIPYEALRALVVAAPVPRIS